MRKTISTYAEVNLISFAINNYKGSDNDLRGCINDQKDLSTVLKTVFSDISLHLFQDSDCTKDRFISEIEKAFAVMQQGVLIIQYSGHGTYVKDTHKDEEDGYDEALYLWNGVLIDDDIQSLMQKKPKDLQIIFLFDSCFSGSITRFAQGYKKNRFIAPKIEGKDFVVRKRFNTTIGDWIVFSGCTEHQTSADAYINGRYNGAFTYYAVKTFQKGITYLDWYNRIRQYLPSADFEQIPTLEGPDLLLNKIVFEY